MGSDGVRGRPKLQPLVARAVPGPCHPDSRTLLQFHRRRTARHARPADRPDDPQMTGAPVLEVDNLTVALRTARGMRRAVDGVSFSIGEGEILGVAGESGSGKTITALS